jgi:hypothetical protein
VKNFYFIESHEHGQGRIRAKSEKSVCQGPQRITLTFLQATWCVTRTVEIDFYRTGIYAAVFRVIEKYRNASDLFWALSSTSNNNNNNNNNSDSEKKIIMIVIIVIMMGQLTVYTFSFKNVMVNFCTSITPYIN